MSIFNEKTTDLDKVRERPRLFTWGKVEKIHDVDRYTIVEHDGSRLAGVRAFHVYVDGKDQSVSAQTLDGALLLAMGIAHLGPNEGNSAACFMARVLKLEP